MSRPSAIRARARPGGGGGIRHAEAMRRCECSRTRPSMPSRSPLPIGLHAEHCRLALRGRKARARQQDDVDDGRRGRCSDRGRGAQTCASWPRPARCSSATRAHARLIGEPSKVSWAICGCAFGRYHEQEEPERMAGLGGQRSIRPGTSRSRAAGPLELSTYALSWPYERLGPGQARDRDVGHGVVAPRFGGRTITTRQDETRSRCWISVTGFFAVAHGTAGGTVIQDLPRRATRHRRRDPRRPAGR